MKLSICMITKNESARLKRALESIKRIQADAVKGGKGHAIETVVVDTGSTDDTMDVIRQYADVAGSFVWCDDFSAARNHSIGLASNDLILVLDSDEWIEYVDLDGLGRIMGEDPQCAGRVERINGMDGAGGREVGHERICRVFDRRVYRYRGRIHEQVERIEKCGQADMLTLHRDVPVRLGHSGYEGDAGQRRAKAERNIRLLLLDLKEHGKDPYTLYQLGKGYYMCGDYSMAAHYFEEGLGFDLDPRLEYVQDMVETYGYTLLQLKRYGEMMFLEDIYDEFATSADYMFLMGLAYMNNERFEEAVAEFEKAAANPVCKVEGCNSFKAYYNAGVIRECLGQKEEAARYYGKCGDYAPAVEGLKRV
jgi:hypothetical protein